MTRLQRLIAERATAWAAAQDIRERVEREQRVDLTTDEDTAYTAALDTVERLTKDIATEERAERLSEVDYRGVIDAGDVAPDADEDVAAQYRAAFDTYMRRGASKLTDAQERLLETASAELRTSSGQSEGTTTLGGFTVPQSFLVKITETLKAYGGIFGVANVIETTDGRTLPWPGNDDTGNVGSIIGENAADSTLDLSFTQQSLAAFTYTSNLIRVSLELAQDSAFDLEAFVAKKIGQRIGRAVAAHLATGSGAGQPKGIDTAPTTGKTGLAGQTTTVIYDDLVDLIHSVDAAYRNGGNCRFAMADLSLAVVRKLKDTQGHPLWQPSVVAGVPDTLLGYGVTVDNGLPAMAVSAKSILFGDFNAGYIVRVVRGVEVARLSERFADQRQVGFFGFMRLDAKPDDAAAVKAYVNSAT